MQRVVFMDVNGAVCGGARQPRWFRLPEKKNILNSVRFGKHAYVIGRTMQILPVGEEARPMALAAPASGWRIGARKALDLLANRKLSLLTLLQ